MRVAQISSVLLHYDHDLVAARRRARQIAAALGFPAREQTRLSTVASEIARNALRYGGGGMIEFGVISDHGADSLVMSVTDRGPGIADLDRMLEGSWESPTGTGLVSARRLMDDFTITSEPGTGTQVVMKKKLPANAPAMTPERIRQVVAALTRLQPEDPIEEMQQQNADLLVALAELNQRQDQLNFLNQELEDTNRGVLALYAELDEKADSIRRSDQLKTRFLSDMSHEFRTPVNAILALTRLLDEANLQAEGRKQVSLIRRAAEDLESLVNDLLDLAKIEAGKVDLRPTLFEVANLFSALRGMMRPLLTRTSVTLVFDDTDGVPQIFTDEAKVAQILRNFISNAIKYTEAGEVRVNARVAGESIVFSVTDSGIGIAPEDQQRIFEEFVQVENPMQRKQKGTGLGLPLTRKLAGLLGGSVAVRSEIGAGSTFSATIPMRFAENVQVVPAAEIARMAASPHTAGLLKILIIDDDETARYTLGNFASRPGTQIIEAENGLEGIARAQSEHPDLVLLDMMMPGIGGHEVLQRLKQDPVTAATPVVIVTSRFVNEEERQQILSKAAAVIYKGDLSREVVSEAVDAALAGDRRS